MIFAPSGMDDEERERSNALLKEVKQIDREAAVAECTTEF